MKTVHLWPDEELYTVGAQVLEEGGGVSDQDPDQRLLRDGIDRGVELSIVHKGEAIPENIGENAMKIILVNLYISGWQR